MHGDANKRIISQEGVDVLLPTTLPNDNADFQMKLS